jgi:hypothetical protein
MPEYTDFRSQLDAILRRRDPQALRAFLISAGQWPEDAPQQPEQQMWLMIAGSPDLRDLHEEARTWLTTHGLQAQADMILGEREDHPQPRVSQRRDHGRPPRTGGDSPRQRRR